MGNRAENLKQAGLSLSPQMKVKKKSRVFETPPWGYTEQESFLNQALMVTTYLEPEQLLKHLKRLEVALGREASFRYGPRLIDIDILFFDNIVMETPVLTIPHPHIHERGFVLMPMMDIAPDLVHPITEKSISEMTALCNTDGIAPYETNAK